MAAWVRQDAIPSYICVNPCNLWETFLCKKLLCIPWVLWEYSSPTDCTDSHRWLVALVVAWVRQDAIPSYICVNLCYLWETLLYKKLLCVPWVLWEYSSPTDCTDSHRWLVALVRPRNPQNSQKFGCVSGCVGTAGCHTLLHLCKSVLSVGGSSLQETSVRSVGSVEYSSPTDCTDQHRWLVALIRPRNSQNSQKFWGAVGCVGTARCHTLLHPCYLWETLLCKKLLCVPWVLWEYHCLLSWCSRDCCTP